MCVRPIRLNTAFNLIDCGKFLCRRGQFAHCMIGVLAAKDSHRTRVVQQGLYTDTIYTCWKYNTLTLYGALGEILGNLCPDMSVPIEEDHIHYYFV